MRAQAHRDRIAAAVNNDFEGGVACPTCMAPAGEACVFGPPALHVAMEELRQAEALLEANRNFADKLSEASACIARAQSQLAGLFDSNGTPSERSK